jgi:hypothetical protein
VTNLNFKTDVVPFIIATAGEFTALFFWLQLFEQGQIILATIVLWAGFLLERGMVVLWLRAIYREREGVERDNDPLWLWLTKIIGVTIVEIVIWIGWVSLANTAGHLLAFVVLTLAIHTLHSVEMATLKRTLETPLMFFTSPKTVFFTLCESIGAAGWLFFLRSGQPTMAALSLLLGLVIEHIIQGSSLKPDTTVEPVIKPAPGM